jgi:hypothetical protein
MAKKAEYRISAIKEISGEDSYQFHAWKATIWK